MGKTITTRYDVAELQSGATMAKCMDETTSSRDRRPRRLPSWGVGAGIGMFTVLWFTVLHQFLISDIWFSFVPMLLAGAACGACLAWNYDILFDRASVWTWAGFIGVHLSILLLLGAASVAVFEPVVPMAVVVAANEPPSELIRQALPLTGGCVVVAAIVTTLLWGRTPAKFGANLLSSFILILFLGLNVSVLGLVEMSTDSRGLVGEFLGLMALIMIGYGAAFLVVERRRFIVRGLSVGGEHA